MMEQLSADTDQKPAPRQRHYIPPPDDDIHRFDELLDELDCPVNTDDYNTAPLLRPAPVEPTFCVVHVHKPKFAHWRSWHKHIIIITADLTYWAKLLLLITSKLIIQKFVTVWFSLLIPSVNTWLWIIYDCSTHTSLNKVSNVAQITIFIACIE